MDQLKIESWYRWLLVAVELQRYWHIITYSSQLGWGSHWWLASYSETQTTGAMVLARADRHCMSSTAVESVEKLQTGYSHGSTCLQWSWWIKQRVRSPSSGSCLVCIHNVHLYTVNQRRTTTMTSNYIRWHRPSIDKSCTGGKTKSATGHTWNSLQVHKGHASGCCKCRPYCPFWLLCALLPRSLLDLPVVPQLSLDGGTHSHAAGSWGLWSELQQRCSPELKEPSSEAWEFHCKCKAVRPNGNSEAKGDQWK